MAVDYARARETVRKMVNTYGRPITLINDSGPLSASNPLGPPADPVIIQNIKGVFVRPSGYVKLGESFYMDPGMWDEAEKIVLVLPSLSHDFATFTRVLDTDGMGFKIFKVEELKPGEVPLLLYIGLRQ